MHRVFLDPFASPLLSKRRRSSQLWKHGFITRGIDITRRQPLTRIQAFSLRYARCQRTKGSGHLRRHRHSIGIVACSLATRLRRGLHPQASSPVRRRKHARGPGKRGRGWRRARASLGLPFQLGGWVGMLSPRCSLGCCEDATYGLGLKVCFWFQYFRETSRVVVRTII